jgi:hypothetical protein
MQYFTWPGFHGIIFSFKHSIILLSHQVPGEKCKGQSYQIDLPENHMVE